MDSSKCEECGKKIKPRKNQYGHPKRFCSAKCENRNWIKKHPRVLVAIVEKEYGLKL